MVEPGVGEGGALKRPTMSVFFLFFFFLYVFCSNKQSYMLAPTKLGCGIIIIAFFSLRSSDLVVVLKQFLGEGEETRVI